MWFSHLVWPNLTQILVYSDIFVRDNMIYAVNTHKSALSLSFLGAEARIGENGLTAEYNMGLSNLYYIPKPLGFHHP